MEKHLVKALFVVTWADCAPNEPNDTEVKQYIGSRNVGGYGCI